MSEIIFDPVAHEYSLDGKKFPSITFLLKYFGMTPDYEAFGNDTARDFGSHVHSATALLDRNNLGVHDSAMDPWITGYQKFIEAFQPRWTALEQPFVSRLWGFAGTPDRFGEIVVKKTSKLAIVEIKTGAEDDSHALQTAGQQVLVEEYYSVKAPDRYTLYLLENDFRLVQHIQRADKTVFLGMAITYNWKRKHGLIK